MARFRYRMQSILNIKEKLEEQAKMEFAAARMHLDEEEEKLQVLFDRKESYENKGRELRKSSLKVPDILENRDAIAVMDEFIFLQKRQGKLGEDELEAARLKLQLARQETRTQERLREKAFEVFIHEENVKEAKEVDELTSYTHGRK